MLELNTCSNFAIPGSYTWQLHAFVQQDFSYTDTKISKKQAFTTDTYMCINRCHVIDCNIETYFGYNYAACFRVP